LAGERVISLVSQAGAVILISRFLGQEVFGEYAVVLTWIALFQMIANFGLSECISREIGKDVEGSQRLVSHSLLLTAMIAALSSFVMFLAASLAQYPSRQMLVLQLAILILFPASTIATCRAVLIGHKRVEYMLLVVAVENLVFLPEPISVTLLERSLPRKRLLPCCLSLSCIASRHPFCGALTVKRYTAYC